MIASKTGEENSTRTVQIEHLEPARFAPFGSYTNLIQPVGPQIGSSPITFYRDMLPLELAGKNPSFCVCCVEARAGVIDVMEYHSSTGEGILPLDGDVLVQVAPATPRDAPFPAEEVRVFHVPRGTMLCLRPGVWHHAPFALEGTVNVLIVLPERTYANDCTVLELAPRQQIQIAGQSWHSFQTDSKSDEDRIDDRR
jgi:ureidoglycolate lyase